MAYNVLYPAEEAAIGVGVIFCVIDILAVILLFIFKNFPPIKAKQIELIAVMEFSNKKKKKTKQKTTKLIILIIRWNTVVAGLNCEWNKQTQNTHTHTHTRTHTQKKKKKKKQATRLIPQKGAFLQCSLFGFWFQFVLGLYLWVNSDLLNFFFFVFGLLFSHILKFCSRETWATKIDGDLNLLNPFWSATKTINPIMKKYWMEDLSNKNWQHFY